MRCVLILFVMVMTCEAQVSYWFQGWERKPDAQQAAAYFMVPGAGINFTYQTNRVIINSTSGGGGGTNIQLFGDVTSPLTALPNVTTTLKNTGTAGTYVKTTFDAQGRETSGVTTIGNADLTDSAVTYNGVTVSLGGTGTLLLSGAGGDFLNEGTTTTVLHGNAAGFLSFGSVDLANDVSGNLGVTHLNSGTDADNSHFWRGDGTWSVIPSAPGQTNIYATNLIGFLAGSNIVFTTNGSGFLAINNGIDTNIFTPTNYSQAISNYTVSVSNLFKSISISNVIFSDDGVTNQAGFNTTSASFGVAVGYNASSANFGVSVGNASVGGSRGVGIGSQATGGPDGVSIGYQSSGVNATAVGFSSIARNTSVSIGHSSDSDNYAVAIGRFASANGVGSVAIAGTSSSIAPALVPAGWINTVELGIGTASLQGGLNFLGKGIVDGNINFYANSVNATNGLFYFAQTNGLVGAMTNPTPLHAWGCIMSWGTNLINGGLNTYATITNNPTFTTARTNLFGANVPGGILTNLLAGFYHVAIHLSGIATNAGALIEGELMLNSVERDEVGFQTQFDPGTPRLKGMSAFGRLYIPANTQISFRIKSSGAGGTIITRAQVDVGP